MKPVPQTVEIKDVLLEEEQFSALGCYERKMVTNLWKPNARLFFNMGLRRLFGYHHQEAIKYFQICLKYEPDCALGYAFMALCHCPNYNFTGEAYYSSTNISDPAEYENDNNDGLLSLENIIFNPDENDVFPCQESAYYYARKASEVVERLKYGKKKKRKDAHVSRISSPISEKDCLLISAIKNLRNIQQYVLTDQKKM